MRFLKKNVNNRIVEKLPFLQIRKHRTFRFHSTNVSIQRVNQHQHYPEIFKIINQLIPLMFS